MRRLLLLLLAALISPTAINAFPWNSDIVVENDLGEKYLVKESTVTVSTYEWDDLVTYLKEEYDIGRKLHKPRCIDRSIGMMTDAMCLKDKNELKDIARRYKKAKPWIDKPTSLVRIKFRPIFIDLNNKKIAKDSEKIYCLNPNLSTTDMFEIIEASGINLSSFVDFPIKSRRHFGITKSKVCKKYAKFG